MFGERLKEGEEKKRDRDGEKHILITDFEQIVEWKLENRCSIEELFRFTINKWMKKKLSRPDYRGDECLFIISITS